MLQLSCKMCADPTAVITRPILAWSHNYELLKLRGALWSGTQTMAPKNKETHG